MTDLETMRQKISIGDTVTYRPGWDRHDPVQATITGIELCKAKREKYSEPVESVETKDILRANFTFSNGCWAYGEQIIIS